MKRWVKFSTVVFMIVFPFFTAAASLTIQGTVTDASKKPVTGASIIFTSESDSSRSWSAMTDVNGKYQIAITTSVRENDSSQLPQSFLLRQNYPNPFNPTTIISFTLSKPDYCIIAVNNIQGQKMRTLVDGYFSAGEHSVIWNGLDDRNRPASAGIYLYQLHVGGKSETKKMLLLDGGVSDNFRSVSSINKPEKSGKIVATTYRVTITGNDIFQYRENGLVISDARTYDFTVIRINQGINFVSIPGGTFQMGDEIGDLASDCRPVHTVTVSSFQMSEAEITNARYCIYLNAALTTGDITATSSTVTGAKGAYSGQDYIYLSGTTSSFEGASCWIIFSNNTFSVVAGYENWPVVWVTWYGAKAFAVYYGWDLAREAEWEYACRGGKQYKYGTDDGTLSSSKANYNSNVGCLKDVGSYPKNPFGLYDMSGNAYEWCADWYGIYSSGSAIDPTGAQSGAVRVVRGGGWIGSDYYCRAAIRGGIDPAYRHYHIGFRIVRR